MIYDASMFPTDEWAIIKAAYNGGLSHAFIFEITSGGFLVLAVGTCFVSYPINGTEIKRVRIEKAKPEGIFLKED